MRTRLVCGATCLAALLVAITAGCRKQAAGPPAPSAPPIPVSRPVQQNVTDSVEYTGRTDAVSSVGIKARVTGYMVRSPFKEGDMVQGPVTLLGAILRQGDLLFEIDPRPYKAQFDQAVTQVAVAQAQLKLAEANYARSKDGFDKGVNSKQDVDSNIASVDEAKARIEAAKASVRLYQLNLDFTQVRAPISGQVSRYYYTLGNLITQDQTLLTTVVSVDPMYAYFDMDERTLLRVRTALNEGKIQAPKQGTALPVQMALEGETGFPHTGEVDFVNNVVNPSTGTIAIRGVFPNALPPQLLTDQMLVIAFRLYGLPLDPSLLGRRLLNPGMFVRIHLPIGGPHPALLVVDSALGSDQGQKYAYVVDAQHKIRSKKVTIGALQDNGLRVIESGLDANDLVVVGALQQLKPGMEVTVGEPIPMPTPGAPSAAPVAK
jgi:RND family efflux transporter MFP subunit